LLAIDDLEETLGVEHADVAGAEIAIGREGVGIGPRILPVACITCGPLAHTSPGSPIAASLSLTSSSLMSVDGKGRPTVAEEAPRVAGLSVRIGDVSERP